MVYKETQSRPKVIYAMLAWKRQAKRATWFCQIDPQSGSLTAAGGVDQMVEKLIHSSPVPEVGQSDFGP